jgi:hypothetical protein
MTEKVTSRNNCSSGLSQTHAASSDNLTVGAVLRHRDKKTITSSYCLPSIHGLQATAQQLPRHLRRRLPLLDRLLVLKLHANFVHLSMQVANAMSSLIVLHANRTSIGHVTMT